jgi:outer membrane protein TolC
VVTTATTFLQGSYQQAFTSGTTLGFTVSNQRQSSTQRSLLFNPSVVTRYSLAITQNLLSGFGFAVNRRFQTVAEHNRRIAGELFRQHVISVLAQAQNLYWDLAASHENIRNAEHALAVARQLYEDNKKREEAGTVSGMDVVAAESEMAARKRDLIIAQSEFQTKELALKNIFSKEIDSRLAAAPIETTDPLPDPKVAEIPKLNEAVAAAMRSRPELRQAEENILKQKVVDRFTTDSLRPRLTAFALLASAGLAGDHVIADPSGGPPIVIPGGLAQAFRQVARLDFPEYAAGVTLTLPLKNRNAQADDLRARLEEQEAQASLQRVRIQIGLEVRKAIISLMQSRARVEAARNAVRLSQEVLNAEEQKLRVGLSTSYDVIRRQRDLVSAQREEVQAGVNYVEALVEMARATGTSLEAANISLEAVLRGGD